MVEFLYLSQDHLRRCPATSPERVLETMRQVFLCHFRGDYVLPDKLVLRWGGVETENTRGRINAMPAFIGGDFQALGLKWIGSFPRNRAHGLPRATAMIVLNDAETGLPLCLMDGSYISALRTAATNVLAAEFLLAPNATTLGVIGAGVQVRFHLEAFLRRFARLSRVRIFNRSRSGAEELERLFRGRYPVQFEIAGSADAVVAEAEVVISSTTSNQPLIRGPFRRGATYFHFSGNECSYEAVDGFDRIYVDDWSVIVHRRNLTPALMHHEGRLPVERITGNLGELVAGAVTGRTGDERIMFCAMGMAIEDVAVARTVYLEALAAGLGERLALWSSLDPLLSGRDAVEGGCRGGVSERPYPQADHETQGTTCIETESFRV